MIYRPLFLAPLRGRFGGAGESKPPRFGTFLKSTKRKVVIIFCLRRGTFVPTKVPKSSRSGRSIETVVVYLAILPPFIFAAFGSNSLNRGAQQREMMQPRFAPKLTAVSQTVSNCHFQRPTLIATFGYRLLDCLKSIQNR